MYLKKIVSKKHGVEPLNFSTHTGHTTMTPNIKKLIDQTNVDYDKIIADLKELEKSHEHNVQANSSLTYNDLIELSMMATRTRLIAMKLGLSHNRNEPTAMDDKNYSLRLQRFAQTLTEIHDFYGKQL
jgi:hypothetical protein